MGIKSQGAKTVLNHNLAGLQGQPVIEFLARFCQAHLEVDRLRFATYIPEPKLSERLGNLLTPEEEKLRDEAVAICHGNGIPFWDALLGICMRRDSIPERFLETAAVHSSSPTQIFDLSSAEVSFERISGIVSQLPDRHGLVVSSKLHLKSGEVAHIPMLDFRCPCSAGNALAIEKVLTLIGQRSGVLVESGRSYHYYGVELFSMLEWITFMARALLFAPIVDPRYVAHRIADGECRLKIVASRDADMPRIINVFTGTN
jgi:hypothetical protein